MCGRTVEPSTYRAAADAPPGPLRRCRSDAPPFQRTSRRFLAPRHRARSCRVTLYRGDSSSRGRACREARSRNTGGTDICSLVRLLLSHRLHSGPWLGHAGRTQRCRDGAIAGPHPCVDRASACRSMDWATLHAGQMSATPTYSTVGWAGSELFTTHSAGNVKSEFVVHDTDPTYVDHSMVAVDCADTSQDLDGWGLTTAPGYSASIAGMQTAASCSAV